MNVFSFVQWKKYFHLVKDEMFKSTSVSWPKSIDLVSFASLNGPFHLSPHENICTTALINIHYLYNEPYWSASNGYIKSIASKRHRKAIYFRYFANEILTWMTRNKLKLNDSKTEFFIVASSHNIHRLVDTKITIGSADTQRKSRILVSCLTQGWRCRLAWPLKCRSLGFSLWNVSRVWPGGLWWHSAGSCFVRARLVMPFCLAVGWLTLLACGACGAGLLALCFGFLVAARPLGFWTLPAGCQLGGGACHFQARFSSCTSVGRWVLADCFGICVPGGGASLCVGQGSSCRPWDWRVDWRWIFQCARIGSLERRPTWRGSFHRCL